MVVIVTENRVYGRQSAYSDQDDTDGPPADQERTTEHHGHRSDQLDYRFGHYDSGYGGATDEADSFVPPWSPASTGGTMTFGMWPPSTAAPYSETKTAACD